MRKYEIANFSLSALAPIIALLTVRGTLKGDSIDFALAFLGDDFGFGCFSDCTVRAIGDPVLFRFDSVNVQRHDVYATGKG